MKWIVTTIFNLWPHFWNRGLTMSTKIKEWSFLQRIRTGFFFLFKEWFIGSILEIFSLCLLITSLSYTFMTSQTRIKMRKNKKIIFIYFPKTSQIFDLWWKTHKPIFLFSLWHKKREWKEKKTRFSINNQRRGQKKWDLQTLV